MKIKLTGKRTAVVRSKRPGTRKYELCGACDYLFAGECHTFWVCLDDYETPTRCYSIRCKQCKRATLTIEEAKR